ncbi:extracellular fatty acid-binding protein-like [Pseudonaja textilis]|uniref:extracellular fatty acid-binding protein-like n=1 Tax=Pseudonaja textilis TaxID=8673 RepID=UPI000EAA61E1|nr:extracellular fatty acid-binding protein-like [Pseudonaja textilis]
MKSLLFALGLALCCAIQAEWEEVSTSRKQDMGRWVSSVIACDSPEHLGQISEMTAFVADLSSPQEDVFIISALIPMPEGCKNITHQLRKGEDGKYHTSADRTDVTVESVKVWGEFVMSTIKFKDLKATTLHGRTVALDPEMLEKFKEECIKLGYKDDEIVVLKPTVRCE